MAHKLSVTVDGKKFEYEGNADGVALMLDRFTGSPAHPRSTGDDAKRPPAPAVKAKPAAAPPPRPKEEFPPLDKKPGFSARDLREIFSQAEGTTYLSSEWPESRADRLLLVLYGLWVKTGERSSTAPATGKANRLSGLEGARYDRILGDQDHLYETRGQRRGKRYGLTAEGVDYCEDLILRKTAESETAGAATPAESS